MEHRLDQMSKAPRTCELLLAQNILLLEGVLPDIPQSTNKWIKCKKIAGFRTFKNKLKYHKLQVNIFVDADIEIF